MSYVSPSDLYAKFGVQKKDFYSADSTTRSKVLNYAGISSDFANLTAHVMAPIIGEAKPNRQVKSSFKMVNHFNPQSYSFAALCTQLRRFYGHAFCSFVDCMLITNQSAGKSLVKNFTCSNFKRKII